MFEERLLLENKEGGKMQVLLNCILLSKSFFREF